MSKKTKTPASSDRKRRKRQLVRTSVALATVMTAGVALAPTDAHASLTAGLDRTPYVSPMTEGTQTVLRDVLRDGDKLHPCLGQLADVELRMQGIAAEPAQGMHDDILERARQAFRLGNHVLEDGAILVQCRGPRFGIDLHDLPAAPFAIGAALGDLVGQRQVAFGLSDSGDANIDGCLHADALRFVMDDGANLLGQEGAPQVHLVC